VIFESKIKQLTGDDPSNTSGGHVVFVARC